MVCRVGSDGGIRRVLVVVWGDLEMVACCGGGGCYGERWWAICGSRNGC